VGRHATKNRAAIRVSGVERCALSSDSGAAFGVLVLVFQEGFLREFFHGTATFLMNSRG